MFMKAPQITIGRGEDGLMNRSSLYQEFLAEREEILRHKWHLSEKAGQDVGFERALLDWIMHHQHGWRKQRRSHSKASH
jgi:hypothetical protein